MIDVQGVAEAVVDRLEEFGSCQVEGRESIGELRAAIRRAGRARGVRLRTHAVPYGVFVYALEPGADARAYMELSYDEAVRRIPPPGGVAPPPQMNHRVLVVVVDDFQR